MRVDSVSLLDQLSNSVLEGDADAARKFATEALNKRVDPLVAMEKGLAKGLKEVGDRFEKGEMFLMQLMLGGEAMKAGLEVLKPELLKQGGQMSRLGTFLIGTVEGDIHDIGKSIVGALMLAEGFDVVDLGVDVPNQVFVEKTKEIKPHIVGMSALMTTTRTKQKEVVEALKKSGLREKLKVMIGGAAVTADWSKEIGADAYGDDAVDATEKARALIKG